MRPLLQRFETILLAVTLSAIMTGLSIEGLTETEWELPSAPAAHDGAACVACHQLVAETGDASQSASVNSERCLACHEVTAAPGRSRFTFHQQSDGRCLDCHGFHNTTHIQAGAQVIAFPFGNQTTLNHCASCHSEGQRLDDLNAGHREAAGLYHSKSQLLASLSPSEGCLICHSRSGAAGLDPGTALSAPRFFEHASHPMGESYTPRLTTGGFSLSYPTTPILVLINGRIECQTCHNLTSRYDKLLPIAESTSQICTACHIRN